MKTASQTLIPSIASLAQTAAQLALVGLLSGTAHAALSPVYTNIWSLNQGSRYDLPAAANNNERGIALNPATGNVLMASRTSSNHISVINGTNGTDIGALDGSTISSGTLALMHVRADDEGVIYACNLSGGPTSTLKIYRWNSEQDGLTNPPVVAFTATGPSYNGRYGDTMDLRGKGTNTQIVLAGSQSVTSSTNFLFLATTDGTNFTGREYPYYYSTNLVGACAKAIAFDGTNNAIYGKRDGNAALFHIGFDPDSLIGTNWLIEKISTDASFVGVKFVQTNGVRLVAGTVAGAAATTNATTHRARIYDITVPSSPAIVLDAAMPQPYFANANVIGATDVLPDGRTIILEPNNGVSAFTLKLVSNLPPTVTSQPVGNTNILRGGYFRLSASASGTSPLAYQWRLNNVNLAGAITNFLSLTNLDLTNVGNYTVVITNGAGSITSSPAAIDLLPSVLTSVSTKLWQLLPGSRAYLTADNNQRGMAFNPLSNHLLIPNRSGTPSVNVLDAATGANVSSLDMTGVGGQAGEQFPICMIGVADDGAVYVCNLANVTSGGAFTIYRWADDAPATIATIAYGPDNPTGERIGDTFAVQGSGVNTKLLASTRNGTKVVVFTTSDGLNYSANVVDVTAAPAGFAGLGFAAGAGDTFWATSSGGFALRKVFYDLTNGTNEVQLALGGQSGYNLGFDPRNDLIADIGTSDTPSNLRILDVHNQTVEGSLLDQEFFGADNDNANGTGAVAFDVTGGRIFALDSNNGLLALKYAGRVDIQKLGPDQVVTWAVPTATLQSSTNVLGTYVDIPTATSPYTNNSGSELYFRLRR